MLRKAIAVVCCSLSLSFCLVTHAKAAPATYTVAPGDTLSAIADRFHVSVAQIVRLNHLRDANVLGEGQILHISALPKKRSPAMAMHKHRRFVASAKHRKVHVAAQPANTPAQVAELRGLWVATHTGMAPPSFAASFAAAQRVIASEVQLTRTALRYVGVPYVWGGESFGGVDCSGFVQAVFRRNGIELPRTADAQFEVGRRIAQEGLQPGDLVFFQTYAEGASHVGIYLGDGRFVHASASDGVRVDSLSDDYYSSRYLGARREAI